MKNTSLVAWQFITQDKLPWMRLQGKGRDAFSVFLDLPNWSPHAIPSALQQWIKGLGISPRRPGLQGGVKLSFSSHGEWWNYILGDLHFETKISRLGKMAYVKSTYCSCGGPGSESQHLRGNIQPPIIPVLGDPEPSPDLLGTRHAHGK